MFAEKALVGVGVGVGVVVCVLGVSGRLEFSET